MDEAREGMLRQVVAICNKIVPDHVSGGIAVVGPGEDVFPYRDDLDFLSTMRVKTFEAPPNYYPDVWRTVIMIHGGPWVTYWGDDINIPPFMLVCPIEMEGAFLSEDTVSRIRGNLKEFIF